MNALAVTGNLTRDPEVREAGENKVASFGVGRSRSKGDDRVSEYYEVEAWGSLAENIEASLSKGDPVCIMGRLRYDQFENEDGEKRTKTFLVAQHVGPDLSYCTAKLKKNGKK